MTFYKKHNIIIINVLLALVVSLVINFSYLLAIRQQDYNYLREEADDAPHTGVLQVTKDGFGYIVCRDNTDSIYVSWRNISRLQLSQGDTLTVLSRPSRHEGGNPMLALVRQVNGREFDYGAVYNRPSDTTLFGLQFGYYFLVALALLFIVTVGALRDTSWLFFFKRCAVALVVAAGFYFLMPVMKFRTEEIVPMFLNTRAGVMFLDPVAILKSVFVLVLVLLYGRTYQLIYQREDIMLENERLKNENLVARYSALLNQINPHFLFNSLNSLSALVREGNTDDALTYIDRLSDTFRYAIQNEPHATTTLHTELEFVEGYKYLLEVRYAEKLFIDIEVDEAKLSWMLPTFSIQPLIENAVKHNTISRARPLHISIRTEGDRLVVSNPINPKLEPENGTGIGLANLSNRWQLLTGRDIEVLSDGATFSVALPFIKTT